MALEKGLLVGRKSAIAIQGLQVRPDLAVKHHKAMRTGDILQAESVLEEASVVGKHTLDVIHAADQLANDPDALQRLAEEGLIQG